MLYDESSDGMSDYKDSVWAKASSSAETEAKTGIKQQSGLLPLLFPIRVSTHKQA